ncbi:hypothetical protein BDV33DRAFT_209460 [Aspergillus novoparasiticus]|uniref:Uncharacterized protein n=1 Tax=Aspergillus novoparasiticus TaxID=986946 RepID=A0A5N6E9Y9_9EURO|nr:hypothetical protein BDV33DRAFT_209460 [Aspergillus novoparasiticus]
MGDSLREPFPISIGDFYIAKVYDSNLAASRVQAKTGNRDDAAIFTLTDGVLRSGDWILSCAMAEDRGLRPKAVYWFRKVEDAAPIRLKIHIDDTWVITSQGGTFIEKDGFVVVPIAGSEANERLWARVVE